MKKLILGIYLLSISCFLWASVLKDTPPNNVSILQQENLSPCVKTLLDGELIENSNLNKDVEGTLQVEDEEDKVYFNLVLKSYVGKDKPPLYLRFMKVNRLDIQQVLKYANIGDEIFIEPFSTDGFKCLPSHFVVT